MRFSSNGLAVAVYVISGICQPLLLTACKLAGLADATAQLYMLFYYAGPSLLLFQVFRNQNDDPDGGKIPALAATGILKACGIALLDMVAQSLNYTGAGMTGATIFAVVYSSVTVWTAVYARLLLGRHLTRRQWIAVAAVVLGLSLAAGSAAALGRITIIGTALTLVGTALHGGTYVLSEFIMKRLDEASPSVQHDDSINTRHNLLPHENSAIQALVAFTGFLLWQVCYTIPRWDNLILRPMQAAGTTTSKAFTLLIAFGLANLFHSYAFYFTVANYPGGSTSAGVFKGLQAALVFVVAHWLYCSADSPGMCFSIAKLMSLVVVSSGVVLYSIENKTQNASETAFISTRSYGTLPSSNTGHSSTQTVFGVHN